MSDGKRLIHARYDEVYKWEGNSDVCYFRQGDRGWYENSNGEKILTEYRRIDGKDDAEPYYVYEKQHSPVVILMEPAGEIRDGRTCFVDGEWVRLDRLKVDEIRDILSHPGDIVKINDEDIEEFYSPFTYIYSAYRVKSSECTPVADCMEQLKRMMCFESSWNYLLIVSVAPGTDVESLDLSEIAIRCGGLVSDYSTMRFKVGVRLDPNLVYGEISIFCLLFFTDRWPLPEESELYNAVESYDKNRVLDARAKLLAKVRELEKDNDALAIAWLLKEVECLGEIPVCPPTEKSEAEIRDFCDFLKNNGASLKKTIHRACGKLAWKRDITLADIKAMSTVVIWAVKNGTDINRIEDGATGLDVLNVHIDFLSENNQNASAMELELLKQFRDLIVRLGGMTAEKCLPQNIRRIRYGN